jgi:hypothetical protein
MTPADLWVELSTWRWGPQFTGATSEAYDAAEREAIQHEHGDPVWSWDKTLVLEPIRLSPSTLVGGSNRGGG